MDLATYKRFVAECTNQPIGQGWVFDTPSQDLVIVGQQINRTATFLLGDQTYLWSNDPEIVSNEGWLNKVQIDLGASPSSTPRIFKLGLSNVNSTGHAVHMYLWFRKLPGSGAVLNTRHFRIRRNNSSVIKGIAIEDRKENSLIAGRQALKSFYTDTPGTDLSANITSSWQSVDLGLVPYDSSGWVASPG